MVVHGRVQNGVLVLTEGAHLLEGQEVTVLATPATASPAHSILDIPSVSPCLTLYLCSGIIKGVTWAMSTTALATSFNRFACSFSRESTMASWTEEEFRTAHLNDKRLDRRLKVVVGQLSSLLPGLVTMAALRLSRLNCSPAAIAREL